MENDALRTDVWRWLEWLWLWLGNVAGWSLACRRGSTALRTTRHHSSRMKGTPIDPSHLGPALLRLVMYMYIHVVLSSFSGCTRKEFAAQTHILTYIHT